MKVISSRMHLNQNKPISQAKLLLLSSSEQGKHKPERQWTQQPQLSKPDVLHTSVHEDSIQQLHLRRYSFRFSFAPDDNIPEFPISEFPSYLLTLDPLVGTEIFDDDSPSQRKGTVTHLEFDNYGRETIYRITYAGEDFCHVTRDELELILSRDPPTLQSLTT